MKDLIFFKDNVKLATFRVDSISSSNTGNITVLETYSLDDRDSAALDADTKGLAENFKKLAHTFESFITFAEDNGLSLVAADTNGRNISLVSGTFEIENASLAGGAEDVAYDGDTLTATGGSGIYKFEVESGTLPAGITLAGTGVLSGTPTTAEAYAVTYKVTDIYFGFTATKELTITITV